MEKKLMDGEAVRRAVRRIAHELAEKHPKGDVVLVGIQTRGVPFAHRLAREFQEIEGAASCRWVRWTLAFIVMT